MKTLDHNAIGRSLSFMGYQLGEAVHRKRHEADDYKLAEVQQQFQIPFSGSVGGSKSPVIGIAAVLLALTEKFIDVPIHFPEVIYYAPLQRNSKNEDPQLWTGVQLDHGNVRVHVHVRNWILNENSNYIGAVVRIVVQPPAEINTGVVKASGFAGTVHATFQGLAIPIEDPGFDEST